MPTVFSNTFSVNVTTQQLITEDTLLQVYPKSVWFRKVIVGTPDSETITLTNPSAASVTVNTVTNSNSEYDITGITNGTVIAPGATETFTIGYNPSAGGSTVQEGSLTLNCNNGQTHVIEVWSSKFDSAITPTPVTTAQDLDIEGANYVLQNDIDATGIAFPVKARHVSFDLNGYTIKYGSGGGDDVHAILCIAGWADPVNGGNNEGLHVYNGTIEQAGYATSTSAGLSNHPIKIRNSNDAKDVEFSNLTINLDGDNARAIEQYQSPRSIWVHDCTINSKVSKITSRHQFDGAQINIHQTNATRPPRVHDNVITGTMQTGVFCASQTGQSAQVYNNTISHTSVWPNDFAIIAGWGADIFNNTIDLTNGSGRGIAPNSDTHIYDNTVIAACIANYWGTAYTGGTDTSGLDGNGNQLNGTYAIQIENLKSGIRVYNNSFTAYADTAGATALRLTETGGSSDIKIFRNIFHSLWKTGATKIVQSGTTVHTPYCMSGTSRASGSGFDIDNNEFVYDAGFMYSGWSYLGKVRITNSTIAVGSNPSAATRFFDTASSGTGEPDYATGNEFIDTTLTGDSYSNHDFDSSVSANYLNGWTLTVVVTSDGSTPISGATVVIDDADALEVSNQTTPANGTVTAELTEAFYSGTSEPGTDDAKTPHNLTISAGGYTTRTPIVTMDSTKTLTVNMTTDETVES